MVQFGAFRCSPTGYTPRIRQLIQSLDAGPGSGFQALLTGSPAFDYDTHVPLVFWGVGVARGRIGGPVTPYDIAPTLHDLLGLPTSPVHRGQLIT